MLIFCNNLDIHLVYIVDMLVNGAMEESTAEELFILQMVTHTLEIGKMLDDTVLVFIHTVMVIAMRVNGEMMKE